MIYILNIYLLLLDLQIDMILNCNMILYRKDILKVINFWLTSDSTAKLNAFLLNCISFMVTELN